MSIGVRGTAGRVLLWFSVVILAAMLAVQVEVWRAVGGRLRPEPGWIKLGMVLSILTICVTIVAGSLSDDSQAKPKPGTDPLDDFR